MPLVAGQRFEIAQPGPADGPRTEPCLDLLEFFNALSLNKVNCETPWLYGCFIFDLPCLWWFDLLVSTSLRGEMRTCNCNDVSIHKVRSLVYVVGLFGKKNPHIPRFWATEYGICVPLHTCFTCFLDALTWLISDINLEQEGFDDL